MTELSGSYRGIFQACALVSIEIPARVETITDKAFNNCRALRTVTFENGTHIREINGFEGCTSLSNIEIPASAVSISRNAFRDCSSLAVLTFEKDSQLKTIMCSAFRNTGLFSVEKIPASVEIIESAAFADCKYLRTVTFEKGQLKILGKLHSHYGDTHYPQICDKGVFEGCILLNSVEIPASVETIDEAAFCGCISLTSIEIPASVKTINAAAFYSCTSLASVTFEENSQLETINSEYEGTFEDCALTAIKIPASVKKISEDAFANNSFDNLTFEEGSQLTFIGYNAFTLSSNCAELDLSPCKQLSTIDKLNLSKSTMVVKLGISTLPKGSGFYGINKDCVLMVPRGPYNYQYWKPLGFNSVQFY